jgi:hypothetical protein
MPPLCVGKPGMARTHDWQPCKITKGGLVCVCTVPKYEKLVHASTYGTIVQFFLPLCTTVRQCRMGFDERSDIRATTIAHPRTNIPHVVSTFGRNLTWIQQGSALIERGVGGFGCQMIACYKW